MAGAIKTYKLLCEYRFKPSLLFFDVKNQIGDALLKDYKHWNHDGLRVNLNNFENRTVLAIDPNRLILEWDVPDSPGEFQTRFERAFKEYTKKVKVEVYVRSGVRAQSMFPVELKFDELVKITQEKLLPQNKRLFEIVGSQIEDYSYNCITDKEGYKIHVVCGPIRKDEIPLHYQPASLSLDPGEQPKEIKYPDVAFFIDCDCYLNQPKFDALATFLDKAIRMVNLISKEITEYVLGGK
jgi:uncharacterized protein (TIGR04255 family)